MKLADYQGRYWRCEPGPKPKYMYGSWVITRVEVVLNASADYLESMSKQAQMGAKWLRKVSAWW